MCVGLQIAFRFVCRAHCWIASEPNRVDVRGLGHEGAMITSSNGDVIPWHCRGSDAFITSAGHPHESRKNAGNTPPESQYWLLFRVVYTASIAMKFSSVGVRKLRLTRFSDIQTSKKTQFGFWRIFRFATPPTLPSIANVQVIGSSAVQFID